MFAARAQGEARGTSGACETGHTITPRGDDTARVRAAAAAAAANSGPIGTTVLLTTGLHAVVFAGCTELFLNVPLV